MNLNVYRKMFLFKHYLHLFRFIFALSLLFVFCCLFIMKGALIRAPYRCMCLCLFVNEQTSNETTMNETTFCALPFLGVQ